MKLTKYYPPIKTGGVNQVGQRLSKYVPIILVFFIQTGPFYNHAPKKVALV